jgi:hypothetical protein
VISFQQHIPNFVDGATPVLLSGETIDDILASELPQRWFKDGWSFCWDANFSDKFPAVLMCETQDKKKWWVLGYLSEVPSSLPRWKYPVGEDMP